MRIASQRNEEGIQMWGARIAAVLLVVWLASGVTLFRVGAEAPVLDHEVPHVRNGDKPENGLQTLRLREQWRVGGEEGEGEDLLLGVIQQVLSDEDGNFYLLDRQLSQVHVFSPDGEFIHSLSREGEGPGESREPADMIFTPDGGIGLVQGFPGKIITIDRSGNPMTPIAIGGKDPGQGGFNFVHRVRHRGGTLAYSGSEMTIGDGGMDRKELFATMHADGSERARILEKEASDFAATRKWVEKDEHFVHQGLWTLGPRGKVYVAPLRDEYAIHVYSPDGVLERIIERDFQPRKRTAEEKENTGDIRVVVNGAELEIERFVEDYAPCIEALRVSDDGELWVLHSRSAWEPLEGIMQTFDVFNTEGQFVRQVAIACEGDAETDRLFYANDDRLVLVKGYVGALRMTIGGGDDADAGDLALEEATPLEVICYAID